jgi:SAM-dependent methyltransferase
MDFDSLYEEIVRVTDNSYHSRIKKRMRYTWEQIYPLISSDSTVAEIGIGPMSALVKRLKGAEVIGIDLNDDQSALCKAFQIDLKTCDIQAEPLPLEDESVDVILFLETIEHLCAYPNNVLDNIYKKLKTGGYLSLSTTNFLRISSRVRVLLGRNPLRNYFEPSPSGRNHIREYVPDEMEYYMRKSGFSIEKTCRFGIPYGPRIVSALLCLAYLYPGFRNYFMITGKK